MFKSPSSNHTTAKSYSRLNCISRLVSLELASIKTNTLCPHFKFIFIVFELYFLNSNYPHLVYFFPHILYEEGHIFHYYCISFKLSLKDISFRFFWVPTSVSICIFNRFQYHRCITKNMWVFKIYGYYRYYDTMDYILYNYNMHSLHKSMFFSSYNFAHH